MQTASHGAMEPDDSRRRTLNALPTTIYTAPAPMRNSRRLIGAAVQRFTPRLQV